MREVILEIEKWLEAGKSVGIATNVRKNGMSLRPLGAKMAATTSMEIAGSVTGGCIEGAVYEETQQVIKTGSPKLLHYGVTGDQKPWDIGLTCGTSLDVFVESLNSPAWRTILPSVKKCLAENQLAAVATIINGAGLGNKLLIWANGKTIGSLGNPDLEKKVLPWVNSQMQDQESTWSEFALDENKVEVFVDVLVPESRLFVIGAGHIAIPLTKLAKDMGYTTIVIDPREAFANQERFSFVDELIVEWPSTALEKLHLDESSYVAVISHDDKLDNPALAVALASSARYVGVLGTRKNIGKRHEALREMGVTDEQLQKLHAPIGLPIGAVLPEEIALAILAEMVAVRHSQVEVPVV